MLHQPDQPEETSAPKPRKREWKLRGAARGYRLKGGPKRQALRPSRANLELLERLGQIGCTIDEVATVLNLSSVTVSARLKKHPELRDSYERGKGLMRISLRRSLIVRAQKKTADGWAAAAFLAKRTLTWPSDDPSDFVIERPPPPDPRLTDEERALLAKIQRKLMA